MSRQKKTITIFIVIVILLILVVSSCNKQELPEKTSVGSTPTHPDLSPTPTTTPTKSQTLSIIQEYFSESKIIITDDFSSLENWRLWQPESGNLENGVFELTGLDEWKSGLVWKEQLEEGDGVILEFQLFDIQNQKSQFVFSSGDWGTDDFRQFGLYNSVHPRANLIDGQENLSTKNLFGNLSLKTDTWYKLMMGISQKGEFIAIMWDPKSPSQRIIYKENLGENWANRTWQFVTQAAEGTKIQVDNFSQISFNTINAATATPTLTPTQTPIPTYTPTATLTPSPTPIGIWGKIAFQAFDLDNGSDTLYIMNPDGSNLERVFDTSELEIDWGLSATINREHVIFSPNGKKLIAIFENSFSDDEVAIVYDLENDSYTQLGTGQFQSFGWSPTGERYFYYRVGMKTIIVDIENEQSYTRETIINNLLSNETGLVLSFGSNDYSVFFEQDLVTNISRTLSDEVSSEHFITKLANGEKRRAVGPVISPDNSSVYYSNCEQSAALYDCMIYRLNLDGTAEEELLRLEREAIKSIDVSPDNQRVVYTHCHISSYGLNELTGIPSDRCKLSYLDLEKNENIPIFESESGHVIESPIWSPDGKYILYLYGAIREKDIYFRRYSILDGKTVDISLDLDFNYQFIRSPDWQ